MDKSYFNFIALQEAADFIKSLPESVADKIYYNIRKVKGGVKDKDLFKKLGDSEIWEFRTLYNNTYYRLFAFWDKDIDTFVIATHGMVKKTKKIPNADIRKAERIRIEYFNNKNR